MSRSTFFWCACMAVAILNLFYGDITGFNIWCATAFLYNNIVTEKSNAQ